MVLQYRRLHTAKRRCDFHQSLRILQHRHTFSSFGAKGDGVVYVPAQDATTSAETSLVRLDLQKLSCSAQLLVQSIVFESLPVGPRMHALSDALSTKIMSHPVFSCKAWHCL